MNNLTYRQQFRYDAQRRALASRLNGDEPFAQLERDESAAQLLLRGLQEHYIECLLSGRLDIWADAAHKIVDLLSSPNAKVHKRSELP